MSKENCKRKYITFNYPDSLPKEKTLLTGVRGVDGINKSDVYISGFYVPIDTTKTTGFVYKGNLNGNGKFYDLNYPPINNMPTITNLYGPNNGDEPDTIQVVGNYTVNGQSGATGCLYEGKLDGSGQWTTITPPFGTVINVICHSTMGGLIVGNYDTQLAQGKAFIYDIKNHQYFDITNENAISITAYGIWDNGEDVYTICGGYTTKDPDNIAYLVDWDHKNHVLENWRAYYYNNNPRKSKVTHFDGITIGDNTETYNLTGVALENGKTSDTAFFAQVKRRGNGTFSKADWCPVSYPYKLATTGNTIYKNVVIGVYTEIKSKAVNGYVSYVQK